MYVERIRELADVIEAKTHAPISADSGFSMDNFEHPCGTPACIAGWAIDTFSPIERQGMSLWSRRCPNGKSYSQYAAELLDLGYEKIGALFFGDGTIDLENITPAHAAAVLRNLAETGEVDWSVGAPEKTEG